MLDIKAMFKIYLLLLKSKGYDGVMPQTFYQALLEVLPELAGRQAHYAVMGQKWKKIANVGSKVLGYGLKALAVAQPELAPFTMAAEAGNKIVRNRFLGQKDIMTFKPLVIRNLGQMIDNAQYEI